LQKEFQIGLCGVVEADLELCCNSWSAEVLRKRLCIADLQKMAVAEWLQSFNSVRGPMEKLAIM